MNVERQGIKLRNYRHDKQPKRQSFDMIDADGLCGEQRLMLAVLVDVINVLKGRVPTGGFSKRQAFAEAAHWVAIRGTHSPFSFDSVCAALNLPIELLRERLSKMPRDRGGKSRLTPGRLRRQPPSLAGSIRLNATSSQLQVSVVARRSGWRRATVSEF
jgi:hypothetical protein